FSSRRRDTGSKRYLGSDVCSSDLRSFDYSSPNQFLWNDLSVMVPQACSRGTVFRLWFRKPVLLARSFDYGSASSFLWHDLSIMVPQARSYGPIFLLWFLKIIIIVRSFIYVYLIYLLL